VDFRCLGGEKYPYKSEMQIKKYMNIINQAKKICLLVSGILLISVGAQASGSMEAILKGVVIDRPQSTHLLLVRQGDDPRINAIHIPIVDGKFEYVLNFDHEEQFELIFNDEFAQGSMLPIRFFAEQSVINFTLHPTDHRNREADRFAENVIEGGKLNDAFQNFAAESRNRIQPLFDMLNAKNDSLREEGKYFTPEAQMLLDQANESDDDEKINALLDQFHRLRFENNHITQTAKMFADSIHQEINLARLQHIKDNPTVVGYSALLLHVRQSQQRNRFFGETNDISLHAELYRTVFAPKFPDHPYTERMETLLGGASIQAGVPFVDFTAVDLNGNPVRLSDRITGKRTVLNLWASWCGPCRRKGRAIIPIYEEFRDKGIVVIGVARETAISNAEAAIRTDGYPWENLVELNDAGQIWAKYGIGNAGGMIFLIDENGIIVASDPTAEEVRDFFLVRE
jgi:thiol-disulfide isomerase/thioredoxin